MVSVDIRESLFTTVIFCEFDGSRGQNRTEDVEQGYAPRQPRPEQGSVDQKADTDQNLSLPLCVSLIPRLTRLWRMEPPTILPDPSCCGSSVGTNIDYYPRKDTRVGPLGATGDVVASSGLSSTAPSK